MHVRITNHENHETPQTELLSETYKSTQTKPGDSAAQQKVQKHMQGDSATYALVAKASAATVAKAPPRECPEVQTVHSGFSLVTKSTTANVSASIESHACLQPACSLPVKETAC